MGALCQLCLQVRTTLGAVRPQMMQGAEAFPKGNAMLGLAQETLWRVAPEAK
jgi:hypothetical protein